MMTRRPYGYYGLGVVTLCLLGMLAGCEGDGTGEGDGPPAATDRDVTTGGSSGTAATPAPTAGARAAPQAAAALPEVNTEALPIPLQMKIGAARQAAQAAPSDPTRVADLGALLYVNGFPAAAVTCFERATQLAPDMFVWWYGLGLAHQKNDNARAAVAAFEKAHELDPEQPQVLRRLVATYRALGDEAKARAFQEKLPRLAQGEQVEDRIELTLRLRGYDIDALLQQVLELARQGDIAGAERMLADAQSLDESGHRSRATRGMVLALQGKLDEAQSELRAVVEAHPDFLPAKFDLARVTLQLGNREEAQQLLEDVLAADPAYTEALERYVFLFRDQEQPEVARAAIQRALEAAPEDAQLHFDAARMLAALRAIDEAIAAARRAVELDPQLARARHVLGVLLYQKEEVDAAEEQWRAALATAPGFIPPRLTLYQVLWYEKKDLAGAEKVLREGYELAPDSSMLANGFAWFLATCADENLRKPEEAITVAQKACQLTGYNTHAEIDTLAAAYAAAGQFDEARKWVAQAIEKAEREVAAAREASDAATVERVSARLEEYRQRKALYDQDQAFVTE
jgi:tetratricopeptide (TPR) repeat protein